MKIDRLIGIISILLQKEKVTAPYLAKKFEVSRRTINRDIETIIQSGIPLYTEQGANGGISIMNGFAIDKTAFTSEEMTSILVGLQSLDSVSGTKRYQQLMDKLKAGSSDVLPNNDADSIKLGRGIFINLSSYHKTSIAKKIECLNASIENYKKVEFRYFSPKGETKRIFEPYSLMYWWSYWYVWGFCELRGDFRMFKLNRIVDLTPLNESFVPQKDIPSIENTLKQGDSESIEVKICFDSEMKWRLIDEVGAEYDLKEEGGKLILTIKIMDKISFFHTLLSYGSYAEIIEPKEIREEFITYIEKIQNRYKCQN